MATLTETIRSHSLNLAFDSFARYFLVLAGFFIPISITATDIAMAVAAILSVLSGVWMKDWDVLRRNPIVLTGVWIVLLTVIAMTWSIAPWADQLSALHKYSKLLYIPLLLPLCKNKRWRDRAIAAFLAGSVIPVAISYLKAWAGLQFGPYPTLPSFVFYTHIETSFLTAFAAYLFAYYAWKQPQWRAACLILLVVFTYQEFFINDGRTGMVAYVALFVLYVIQRMKWMGVICGVAAAILLSITLYYTSPTFQNTFKDSIQNIQDYHLGHAQTSLGYRLSFFDLSMNLIKEQPVLGYGTGSFAVAANQVGGVPGWRVVRTPHNEYLMMMVEFGAIGLLSLLLLFYFQWKISFCLEEMQYLAQALLVAFMLSSCYNAFLYLTVSGHFFVLFTALLYAGYHTKNVKS